MRPATHAKAHIESYSLRVRPECALRWQQDPFGNHVARATFAAGVRVPALDLLVEIAADIRPVNPFDFFLDDRCQQVPFQYPEEFRLDLRPFLDLQEPPLGGGSRLAAFLAELPAGGRTVPLVVSLNEAVNRKIRYVIREEAGIWTPEETLAAGRGSCRDSAVLLMAALRSRGLAARFASGYLVQLADEGMIPDVQKGVGRDVVDLHAWAEVFLPGAGWIGLDATSGLLCGEGHIPVACTASPALAAPVEGTSDVAAGEVSFQMTVARLGHEPRPTAPYEEAVWQELLAAGDRADARLAAAGVALTVGGEPTFNARDHAADAEWNGEALGPTKWTLGVRLAEELRRRLIPGAAVLLRMGKHYPGESLPRWALDLCGRRDGVPAWRGAIGPTAAGAGFEEAGRFAVKLARRLGHADLLLPAHEDPWRFVRDETALPVDVDPMKAGLDDPEDRRRLARVLDQGLGRPAGYVLPLTREDGALAERGLGLPARPPVSRSGRQSHRPAPAPRLPPQGAAAAGASGTGVRAPRSAPRPDAPARPPSPPVRTALSVEARDGVVNVFLPPLLTCRGFLRPGGRSGRGPRGDGPAGATRRLPATRGAEPLSLVRHPRPRRAGGEPPARGQPARACRALRDGVRRRAPLRPAQREVPPRRAAGGQRRGQPHHPRRTHAAGEPVPRAAGPAWPA